MTEGSKYDLAEYRLKRAVESIRIAKDNLALEHFGKSIAESYYAMFAATRAVLALKEIDSKTHRGVIFLFDREYVKTGIIPPEYGKYLARARTLREKADYGDFVKFTQEEAEEQIKKAEDFIEEIRKIMQNKTNHNRR